MQKQNPITKSLCSTLSQTLALTALALGATHPVHAEHVPHMHSYANPTEAKVTHTHLDLTIDFNQKILYGKATLDVERITGNLLKLDASNLTINSITGSDATWDPTEQFKKSDLGEAIIVHLPTDKKNLKIVIDYKTSPNAPGLQWLNKEQTSSKNPFMFAMNEPIGARSWFPCQDTPAVRGTYSADLKVVANQHTTPLMAVASSGKSPETANEEMVYKNLGGSKVPIPSYLFVIAAGELYFKNVSPEMGFYANNKPDLDLAVTAFQVKVPQYYRYFTKILGTDPWRYHNFLFLPPMFAFGGMENPQLIYINSGLIEKTGANANVLAHELAHQWTGNKVTNSRWEDFWLNEGWTVKIENLALTAVHGKEFAQGSIFERYQLLLGHQAKQQAHLKLEEHLRDRAKSQLTQLAKDNVSDVHPDDLLDSSVYAKGATMLSAVEKLIGKEPFIQYARHYTENFALQSIDTDTFINYSVNYLGDVKLRDKVTHKIDWNDFLTKWIRQPGAAPLGLEPEIANLGIPKCKGDKEAVESFHRSAETTDFSQWNRCQILTLIAQLKEKLAENPVETLDQIRLLGSNPSFKETISPFYEVQSPWYVLLAKSGEWKNYQDEIRKLLNSYGRGRILNPIYEAFAEIEGSGQEHARKFIKETYYSKDPLSGVALRDRYFSSIRDDIDDILKNKGIMSEGL